jgi:hypothetical protein
MSTIPTKLPMKILLVILNELKLDSSFSPNCFFFFLLFQNSNLSLLIKCVFGIAVVVVV